MSGAERSDGIAWIAVAGRDECVDVGPLPLRWLDASESVTQVCTGRIDGLAGIQHQHATTARHQRRGGTHASMSGADDDVERRER
ncbi:MAG: hypothetical protein ABIS17_15065 [Casimicrobiaceae bacterium]